jgi:hypothetical protein
MEYAGLVGPDPDARDIETYETILSGDFNEDDHSPNDPAELFEEPTRSENAYHVVTGSETDATAVLDGFTITGGNAKNLWTENDEGGGIIIVEGSPTLRNCTFEMNLALNGGGMRCYRSSPTIINCIFRRNSAAVEYDPNTVGGERHQQCVQQPS